MSLPDSIRRFRHTQVENKEPIRKELAQDYEHYVAQGRTVTILPGPSFAPKPKPLAKPAPKAQVVVEKLANFDAWNLPAEIELVRQLKTETTLTNDQIAAAVREKFGTNRNGNAIKGICRREGIKREPIKRDLSPVKVLGAAYGPGGWEPRQDALLRVLLSDQKTIPEICQALKDEFGSNRSYSSVTGRMSRLGLRRNSGKQE